MNKQANKKNKTNVEHLLKNSLKKIIIKTKIFKLYNLKKIFFRK